MPDSDVADANPPSPSEDFYFYSQLILCIAKATDLDVQQVIPNEPDKVYEDINQDQTPPLHMGFIPSLLKLIKESWSKPSTIPQISRCIENLYRTHEDNTTFLSMTQFGHS